MNSEYSKKSVLTEPMQSIRSALEARVVGVEPKAPHLLFNVHISTFIKLDWIGDDKPEHKTACLEGSVELALSVGYCGGKVIAAVIDQQDPWASEAVELLEKWQIDFLVADLQIDEDRVVQFFIDAWGRRSEQRYPPKSVTNLGENWFREVCDYATGRLLSESKKTLLKELKQQGFSSWHIFKSASEKYEIFREVALDKIVKIPRDETKQLEFSRMSSVDLVVTHPSPNMLPFLAIEIDGPHHEKPAQIRKDKLKDSILASAEIPILRLALKDRGFDDTNRSNRVVDFNEEKVKIEFSKLLEHILRIVIESLYSEKKYIPELYKKTDQALAQALEMSIQRFQLEHSRIDIPDDVVDQIIEDAKASCHEVTSQAEYEEFQLWSQKRPMRSNDLLANDLAARLGDAITSFEYDVDNEGFSRAICCIDENGIQTSFQSPKIRLTMSGLNLPILEISFQDILKEASRSYVIQAAYSHLNRELPLY
jgi:hypothetical protein